MATVRAKFHCNSIEHHTDGPQPRMTYRDGKTVEVGTTHPRTFRFYPQYDPDLPEDQRYALATPSGELRLQVDNPAVAFEIGKSYYLDFTPVE